MLSTDTSIESLSANIILAKIQNVPHQHSIQNDRSEKAQHNTYSMHTQPMNFC